MANYAPTTDRKGCELHPGDRVRFKLYPRGTAEGVVVVSKRSLVVMPAGTLPALSIQTDDGTLYGLIERGTLKLNPKRQG